MPVIAASRSSVNARPSRSELLLILLIVNRTVLRFELPRVSGIKALLKVGTGKMVSWSDAAATSASPVIRKGLVVLV